MEKFVEDKAERRLLEEGLADKERELADGTASYDYLRHRFGLVFMF